MKTLKYFLIALLFPAFVLTGCKEEADDNNNDEVTQPAFEILTDYLLAQDLDLNHVIKTAEGKKFVTAAPAEADVTTWAAGYHIIDIRSAEKFANPGHIDGAINVAFGDILTEAAKATKPILVVCYTGQTACFATALLRMSGYDAQALKWGMSGWNEVFNVWKDKTGNVAEGHANWVYDAAPTTPVFEAPTLSSTSTDGKTILEQQIQNVIAEGFGANLVSGEDVLTNPSAYYINNYFSEGDYTGFGHIKGAYRINPMIVEDNTILGLDPDGKVVTYCYTGQTSAVITAYLNVLGYDAYSLGAGMNNLYNSNASWTTNQWGGDSNPKSLPYVQ